MFPRQTTKLLRQTLNFRVLKEWDNRTWPQTVGKSIKEEQELARLGGSVQHYIILPFLQLPQDPMLKSVLDLS